MEGQKQAEQEVVEEKPLSEYEIRCREERARNELLRKRVRFFPGSKAEYEDFVGYPVDVVDFGLEDLGLIFYKNTIEDYKFCLWGLEDDGLRQKALDRGVEALVNARHFEMEGTSGRAISSVYGLPVAKRHKS